MQKIYYIIILTSAVLFSPLVSYADSLGNNSNLYLPNSQKVRISPESDRSFEDKEEASPVETPTTFRGIQANSISGSNGTDFQRSTSDKSYNTNSNRIWASMAPDSGKAKVPFSELQVFGVSLFNGNFSGTYYDERNPEYMVRFGDRIGVRVWGAFNFEQELTVDRLGNIFIPTVGPVKVAGAPNVEVPQIVRKALNKVYAPNYYDSYIDLVTSQPISVFVSGYVNSPGRYAGGVTDSVLFFLDLAGGIDSSRGSYREIEVVREGEVVAVVDLYKFLLEGRMGGGRLKDGDVIVVKKRGIQVGINGHVRTQAWFEFRHNAISGDEVMKWVDPLPGVTHVSVWGYRNRSPLKKYLKLDEFENFLVYDTDTVEFIYDEPSDAITIYADGALDGRSQFFVKKGTRLHDVLNYIQVDKGYAKLNSIYLRRLGVAKRQGAALQESLFRLEQNALTSSSDSVEEASIRVKEAELISKFVERAKRVEPQGVVAISHDGVVENVYLQDGDIIVVPNHSDVVLISGEVVVPNAIVYKNGYGVKDYIAMSGGLSNNADEDNILLFKTDGRIFDANINGIEAGDAIMVLPKYESKNLQFAKDLTQIFFQIAVGTRAVLTPIF